MADAALGTKGTASRNIFGFLRDSFPATAVIVIVIMLILPLPTVILDALMAINLMLSLLILLIVIYAKMPTVEFSSFPTMLLVTTVFSLALNISSTRLILRDGMKFDGRMVRAFSRFVVGSSGNEGLVIGFIIFIIVIAVQAFVITKGATRISEVAARFRLDAMQVKIMSIETEYNSGSITEEEAKIRKAQIQSESDFFGAMDGASKFISGNVKIGILITIINVIGGIIVGMSLHGEPLAIAANNYVSLAIGDGLVSQFPALFVSVAMGIVVSRSAESGNFSEQVMEQIFYRPAIIYWILAVVLVFLAVLPGFPWYVLLTMAAIVGAHAHSMGRRQKKAASYNEMMTKTKERKDEKPEKISPVVPFDALSLELGYGLVPLVEKEKGAELLERVQGIRRQSALDLGLVIPMVRIIDNSTLEPSEYCFKIKGVDSGRGKIRIGYYLCINPGTVTTEMEGVKTVDPAFGIPAIWIEQNKRDEAERCGYTVVDPPSIIATHLTEIIRRHAAEILGLQDTQAILDELRKDHPAVVEEVLREGKGLRITEIQKVLHGLLRERVSIRNMVSILESIADYASVSKNIWFLTEKARQALASQICSQYADDDHKIHFLSIDPALEKKLFESKYETPSGVISALDPPSRKMWINAVSKAVAAVKERGWMPVIICGEQARFLVKNSTDRELPELAVLSVQEIVPDVILESVGMIQIDNNSTE